MAFTKAPISTVITDSRGYEINLGQGSGPFSGAPTSIVITDKDGNSVTVGAGGGGGSGTVTTTGSPASGNLSKFSGATSITNADLTGDVTTAGTVAATIAVGAVTDTKASLSVKPTVGLVANSNLTLTGAQTIDGVLGVAGTTLVLATAQSTGSQNGPWVMQSGAWTRPTWYPAAGTTQAFQFITVDARLGTLFAGSTWRLTSAGAVTIDTTATTWAQVAAVISAASVANGITGSGAVVLATSPTIVTPTIASFASSTHTHQNTAGGGTLDAAAIASGSLLPARGGVASLSGTGVAGFISAGLNLQDQRPTGTGAGSLANGVRVFKFVLPYAITLQRVTFNVSSGNTGGTTLTLGIYDSAGTTKLLDSGALTTASAGIVTGTFTPVNLAPGAYWFAHSETSATPQFTTIAAAATNWEAIVCGTNPFIGTAANAAVAGVLPATLGVVTPSNITMVFAFWET